MWKSQPCPGARRRCTFPGLTREIHGPVIPAAQSAARQQARLPRTDENSLGARYAVPPAEEGTQAPRRPPAVQTPESLTDERFPRRVRLARGSDLTACWDQGARSRTAHLDAARPLLRARERRHAL